MPVDQIGCPVSVAVDGFNGTSDVIDWEVTPDITVNEHESGSSGVAAVTIGDVNMTIRIKTADRDFYSQFVQGMDVGDVTLIVQDTRTSVTKTAGVIGYLPATAKQYTFSFSNAFVSEVVPRTANADGSIAQVDVTFKAQQTDAGADPTIKLGELVAAP